MLCNSCNADFIEEVARSAHYRSEWHRYNLKRKVAGLPGVTEEWFEARKAAAAAAVAQDSDSSSSKLECTVCCKQYCGQKAFENHLRSKGHVAKASLAPAGAATSAPVVRERKPRAEEPSEEASAKEGGRFGAGKRGKGVAAEEEESEEEGSEEGEEWEEVDDEEEAAVLMEVEGGEGSEALPEGATDGARSSVKKGSSSKSAKSSVKEEEWEWDCSQCLFCDRGHTGSNKGHSGSDQGHSGSVEECVAHMHRAHGFFVPDTEFVEDLPGLLSYLALKINRGFLCLYCDERGKAFPSAEAVRAHMTVKCHAKLRYGDGSGVAEEELEEFYDFSPTTQDGSNDTQMVLSGEDAPDLSLRNGGAELVIRLQGGEGDGEGVTTRVIGSRENARYYRQKPRPEGSNDRLLKAVVSRYKSMGLTTSGVRSYMDRKELAKRDTGVKASQRAEKFRSRVALSNNVIRNLPKNVPY